MTRSMAQTMPAGGAVAAPVVPLGQTTVLSSDDLMRIKTTLLHADAKTQGTQIKSEVSQQPKAEPALARAPAHACPLTRGALLQDDNLRETLRDMSQARMGGWNNTLEARRRQKEADRQAKIDEEEKRRQVQDREEAAFQAAERKRCIQRANTLVYENTERVQAFGSKLYLSDVMKEREMQIEIKNQIKARKDAEERMWHERTIQAVKMGDAEEDRKREERQQRALHAKQVQLDQLEDFRVRYIDNKRGEKREGELIKQRVEMHIAEEKRQEKEKKEAENKRSMQTLADNRKLQEEKRISELQAREDEEKRIQYFAEEKERKMKMRAEREAEIAAQKQAIRQRMIDRQVAYLQSLRKNENERIAGQAREAEAKRDAEISAKNDKMRQELEAIRNSTLQQLADKAEKKQKDYERGMAEAAKFRADYQAGVEADRAAEAARREKRLQLKATHLKQAKAKMYRLAKAKDEELEEQEMVRMKLMEEDLLFDKYTQALIAQYKADGKNIKPLLLELAAMKAQGR